ncbi:hypothetical protein [Marmoricola sp. RAF53]|uniref:hypothetical protein n=1 Tax=Marmoricola sp. RAF53 TaxID=3233059 RepID=UPI003F97DD2E
MTIWTIGVDPASRRDRYAVSVIRKDSADHAEVIKATWVRGVESDHITRTVCDLVAALDKQIPSGDRIAVAVDRGGLGLGPAEAIQKRLRAEHRDGALKRRPGFRAVAIVAGDRSRPDEDRRQRDFWSVGRDLLTERSITAMRTQALGLREATGNGAAVFQEELTALVNKRMPSGRTRVDHKAGANDDVLMSCHLAYWLAQEIRQGGYVETSLHLLRTHIGGGTGPSRSTPDLPIGAPASSSSASASVAGRMSPEQLKRLDAQRESKPATHYQGHRKPGWGREDLR